MEGKAKRYLFTIGFFSEQEEECRGEGQYKTDERDFVRLFVEEYQSRNRGKHNRAASHHGVHDRSGNLACTEKLERVRYAVADCVCREDHNNGKNLDLFRGGL